MMKWFFQFLLFCETLKILINGASFPDAIILVAFAALNGFLFYMLDKKEEPINEKAKKDILLLATEIDILKSTINSLKLGTAFFRNNK